MVSFILPTSSEYIGTLRRTQYFIEKLRTRVTQGIPDTIGYRTSSYLLPKYIKIKIYRTIILSALWYGCRTWSLTLKKEHCLRVFENRVLKKTFEPKKREVTEELRKLHVKKLHELYFSQNIMRMIKSRRLKRPGGACGMYGEGKCIQGFGGYT